MVVWRDDNLGLPAVIVVPTAVEDFYAWSSAYLSHLTPLSSVVRVVERDWRPRAGNAPSVELERLLGFWLAEVAVLNWFSFAPDEVALSDCVGTFTSCLWQASRAPSVIGPAELAKRWLDARQLLGLPRLPFRLEDMLEVWKCSRLVRAVGEETSASISEKGSDQFRILAPMLGNGAVPNFENVAPEYVSVVESLGSGPLEDRVRDFKGLVRKILRDQRIEDDVAGVVVGFALSCISQGTFRHMHLIGPRVVRDARAVFWYGQFEGARAGSVGASWLGGNTGHRLRRALRLGISEIEEECDVDLEELRVLSRGLKGPPRLATEHAGYVRVRLCDGVVADIFCGLPLDERGTRRGKPEQGQLF
ncbi:hypothetical protein ACIHQR_30145 [Corallococcus coralloides]|uniref:hypothetical protein n=1 Tax=Corallococcus coralloides TaxID=184914 RepID=UPI00384C39B7